MRVLDRDDVVDNKSYKRRLKDKAGVCPYCSFHRGDNAPRPLKWGKKVAAKRRYSTGKGRSEEMYLPRYQSRWGYRYGLRYDARYDPFEKKEERRKAEMKTSKSDALQMIDGYIKFLKTNRNKIADDISRGLNNQGVSRAFVQTAGQLWSSVRGDHDVSWEWWVSVARCQKYRAEGPQKLSDKIGEK